MDRTLQQRMRKFVDESVRVMDSNPIEIADYMFALYTQHNRLDKLYWITDRLWHRMHNPDG